jgi:hypothetical protein
MQVKPIDTLLKSHFEKLLKIANDKAANDFDENITKKIIELNDFDTYNILLKEGIKFDNLKKDHLYPFYIDNHSSVNWLLSQFANRTFLLNKDESEALIDSVYIGKYRHLISEHKEKIRESIPKYTFEQFINGEICEYFSLLHSVRNVSEEDYYKIRDWQREKLQEIVQHDSKLLIHYIQEDCKLIKEPLEIIKHDNEIIEKIYKLTVFSEIKNLLNALFIIKYFDIDLFDEELLILNFKDFSNENLTWNLITPNSISLPLKNIEKQNDIIVSNEYTLFFTLNELKLWLEEVLEGKSLFSEVIDINWELTINDAFQSGEKKAFPIIEKINEVAYDSTKTKKEIKKYLFELIHEYRRKFNEIDSKYYFHFFDDEKIHLLNNFFITNSFFGNNVKNQINLLTESKFIHDVSWEVVQTYYEIFEGARITFTEKKYGSSSEIYFLINKMILDKELYEEFHESSMSFFSFNKYRMPIDFFFMNHYDRMSSVFTKAIDRLQETLDESETTNKIIYIQSRIKELRQRELQLSKYKDRDGFSKRDYTYSTLLKDFLVIESDFINETKSVNDLKFLKTYEQKSLPSSTSIKIDIISDEKMTFVLKLLEDLSITTNGTYNLSERKKGAIRGIVIALREENILPNQSIEILSNTIAAKIGLIINSKLDSSTISDTFEKKARVYIKEHYKK